MDVVWHLLHYCWILSSQLPHKVVHAALLRYPHDSKVLQGHYIEMLGDCYQVGGRELVLMFQLQQKVGGSGALVADVFAFELHHCYVLKLTG